MENKGTKKTKKTKKTNNTKQGIRWYLVVIWSLFAIGVTCGFGLFYGISHEWFGDMPTFEELENPSTNILFYYPMKYCKQHLQPNMVGPYKQNLPFL